MRFSPEIQMIGARLAQTMSGEYVRFDGRMVRVDAAVATAFTARELEHVKAQTYDIKKVPLKARQFIPVSTDAHPGAEFVSYDQYDSFGEAEIVESYADDSPGVDAEKQNFPAKVFGFRAHYDFSIQDLRAAMMSGSRLLTIRPMQARRAIEAKFDRLAARGIPRIGKTGFINNPAVDASLTPVTLTMGSQAVTVFRYLNSIAAAIPVRSNDVERADSILFPTKAFQIIAGVMFGQDSGRSVLDVWLERNPYGVRRADQWTELDGAGAGGLDRIVCYRYDRDVAEVEVPQDYEEFPPEVRGLITRTECHMRSAGTVIRYPGAMQYADGTFDPEDLTDPEAP